ncbi:hypothetical protein AB6E50_05660 [Vibrio cyclitrophicus]
MIDELWTSIRAYLYDRTSSPLLGAIVTGLLIWNFKILILVFSSNTYALKVWEMDYFYSQTFFVFRSLGYEHWIFSNYVFCIYLLPLVTAIFYIFIFPEVSIRVFKHSYEKQLQLIEEKKKLQGSAILTEDDKDALLQKVEESRRKNRAEIVIMSEQIATLESQRDTSTETISHLERIYADLITTNEELESENNRLKERFCNIDDEEYKAERLEKGKRFIADIRSQFSQESTESANESDNDQINLASVNFYFNADEVTQSIYKDILSKLYLRDLNFRAYSGDKAQIDNYMPDLIINKLVEQPSSNTFRLSNEGRRFFENLKKQNV